MFRSRPPSSVTSTAKTTGLQEPDTLTQGITVLQSPDSEIQDRRVVIESDLCLCREATSEADLVIDDPRISRRHALIALKNGGDEVVIRDLGSRNGTFVNGRRITTTQLTEGSIVRIGDTLLEFGPLRLLDQLPDANVVGWSNAFSAVLAELRLAAASTLPLLLLGEPGAGKNLLAQRVHELSERNGPFVAVNCGAIPAELVESYLFGHRKGAFTGATADSVGFFEKANGGTLFLDEVGALGLAQQPKLLRVLESQEFSPVGHAGTYKSNARIVAATNSDLRAAVAAGSFRHDLFTRLSGFVITVPPLRQRRSDIPLLIRHFFTEFAPERTVEWTVRSLEALLLYSWPGNVRELRFLIQRLALLEDTSRLTTQHLSALLPPWPSNGPAGTSRKKSGIVIPPAQVPLKAQETPRIAGSAPARRPPRGELVAQLTRFNGNVTRLAAHYDKDPKQIYRWMNAYGIRPDDFRPR